MVFVDRVVCQVHEFVVQVLGTRRLVLLSSESGQTLLVDEDPQGVDTRYEDVDTHVELQTVD
jgi:hypothetical protein